VIQVRKNTLEIAGRPVSPADIGEFERGGEVHLGRPVDVIADEQVQLSVVIVIDPGGAGAPAIWPAARASFGGGLPESAVALVPEEMVSSHRGDEEIHQAVVVVIARGNAHAVETEVQARPGSDVFEPTLTLIMIQGHKWRFLPSGMWPGQ